MAILISGGAGYIGSHTCVELLQAGYELVVFDNFINSRPEALEQIREISGKDFSFYQADMLDTVAMRRIFAENHIDALIHFAGLKAVGESVAQPLLYYHNNVGGTLILLQLMQEFGVKRLVFSSSATVYGDPVSLPIRENFTLSPTNPYGATKLAIENILRDLYRADDTWSISLLRYFNPVGAHPSGLIGENPLDLPNNLMPYICQVATGQREFLNVFGNDYPTPDGTGVRDYIHVVDLSLGHLKALQHIMDHYGVEAVNLGTGQGYSVLEIVNAFEHSSDSYIPYRITDRRPGDIAACWADPTLAQSLYGWRAERDLDQMCADAWNFTKLNQAQGKREE